MPSPQTITVGSPGALQNAFKTIADGGRIELLPGDYYWTGLQSRDFDTGVTVASRDADDPAVFTDQLLIRNVGGLTLENVDITAAGLAGSPYDYILGIQSSNDITVRGVDIIGHIPTEEEGVDPDAPGVKRFDPIIGYGYERGINVRFSQNVQVEDVSVADVYQAVRVNEVEDATFTGLEIHGAREGFNVFDVRDVEIAESLFRDFQSWRQGPGDHSDMIQFWTSSGDRYGVDGFTLRDNVFHRDDPMQTQSIFGVDHDRWDDAPLRDFVITGNTIMNAHSNGIRLSDVDGLLIAGNMLLPGAGVEAHWQMPGIHLTRSDGAQVVGNTVVDRGQGQTTNLTPAEADAAGITIADNVLLSRDPGAPDFWGHAYEALLPLLDGPGDPPRAPVEPPVEPPVESPVEPPVDSAEGVPAGPGSTLFEAGTLTLRQDNADQWHAVRFAEPIADARVVMGPPSDNGVQPVTLRVRNVTETGFEVQLDEWDFLDGGHVAETVGWVAGSAGTHRLSGGQTVAFGRTEAQDDTPVAVTLSGFSAAPSVFAQVTSTTGSDAVTDRIDAVGADGFIVRMQKEEANDQRHSRETVDWMALSPDAGGPVAAHREIALTDEVSILEMGVDPDSFVFLADMQTAFGDDPATLRGSDQGDGRLGFRLQEETSADDETWHNAEDVAIAALQQGVHDLLAVV